MDHAARRPMLALATLTTAGALALTPVTVTPPDLHAASVSPLRVSSQAVALTDAWSDLVADTFTSAYTLGAMFLGADSNFPLPSPTIPLAPIATQLVLNQFIYVAQLFTGQAGQIPGEIATHLNDVGDIAGQIIGSALPLLGAQLKLPFVAAQTTLNYIANSGNPLTALVEAPAIFLNLVLNNQYGLLGQIGPIGFPIIVRNLLASALYTTPPTIVLPFKKASAATLRPKATATTVAPASPSGTGSSARPKSKAPSSAASSNRKAASAKAGNNGGGTGQGHSKRG